MSEEKKGTAALHGASIMIISHRDLTNQIILISFAANNWDHSLTRWEYKWKFAQVDDNIPDYVYMGKVWLNMLF